MLCPKNEELQSIEGNNICENCANRFSCIVDASANVKKCDMYKQQPDFSVLFDVFADKIAEKVVEKLKTLQEKY